MRVKICGFTDARDVADACTAGADMVGVVVDTPSPRNVEPERARTIFAAAPKSVARVAVMIPKDTAHAIQIARRLKPDYLQIYGSMSVAELEEIKKITGVRIIAAVGVPQRVEQLQEITARAREVARVADLILTDTRHKGVGGGTGLTHNWDVSLLIREAIDKPLILSGGLNPMNVRKAIEVVKPYGVDVASGVEFEPGKKNPELVRKFIKIAKG